MAKTPTLLSLCFLTALILILNSSLVNSNGLTIRLIHPDSSESPFFQSDLSSEERIKRLVSQSNYLAKTSSSAMRTEISAQYFHYTVKVGIGTFKSKTPYKEYYLEMGIDSSLVWMQCEGCTKCFKQVSKPFPKQNSSSFHLLLIENRNSTYEYKYLDGSSTRGVLALETFYLTSNTRELAKIENLKFGCGLYSDMQFGRHKNNKIAGIMGLGWGDLSFVKQLGPQIKGQFSYCLPVVCLGKRANTYLRFGDDIVHRENSKITPLYRRDAKSSYYVEIQGISLNGTRLNISSKMFEFENNGRSDCKIDSGTPYSRIIKPAFDILRVELEKYFSVLKGLKKINGNLGLELCYERSKPGKFSNLPDVTLHLRGSKADFVMKAEAAFEVVGRDRLLPVKFREYFCLAMVSDPTVSIIGAHQLTNHRIIHDMKNKQMVFYPEDCSKNP